MLALDDGRWSRLQTTYGDGRRVARLLSAAAGGAPVEDWYDDLFQELCHQYTVSEAAYAALPHLVRLATQSEMAGKHLLVLIGACYAAAQVPGARPVPEDLEEAWHSAARAAIPLVGKALAEPALSESDLRYLLFSIAALHGYQALAYAIEGLDTEIACPNCGLLIDPMASGLNMSSSSEANGGLSHL
jgi:hypothetical protein